MERAVWKTLTCLYPLSLLMLYYYAVSLYLTSLLIYSIHTGMTLPQSSLVYTTLNNRREQT